MIDEALLRPGRMEVNFKNQTWIRIFYTLWKYVTFQVQMEIGLPNEYGRVQILKIHTARMVENKKIASDVDLLVRTY